MRIVHRGVAGERVVDVDIDDNGCRVGDLIGALEPHGPAGAEIEPVIDGAPATSDTPLSAVALCEGSVVDTTDEPATTNAPARTLAIVGGLRAGVRVAADAWITIGRGARAELRVDDPALSALHARLEGTRLRDLRSRNGTAIEGHVLVGPAPLDPNAVVRAGTSRFSVRVAIDDCPVAITRGLGARGGTIPFNRPPRITPPSTPLVVHVPGLAPVAPTSEPLSIAGIVLPIVAGAVVAMLFSPFMAIFAALGPVLTVGTWWERRRRARRDHRRATEDFSLVIDSLRTGLPMARASEIVRRRALHPDLAEVVRRAESSSVRVWERRPDHPDAFIVALGADDEPFGPETVPADGKAPAEEALQLIADLPLMPDVPVAVDLSPGHVVGLVGDRAASLAIARSLLVQMATHHGPADLSVAIGTDDPLAWLWTGWLPQTADQAAGRHGATLLQTDDVAGAAAVVEAAQDRVVLAVIDGADPFQGRSTVGRRLIACVNTSAVVLVRDEQRLPARCDMVLRTDRVGRVVVFDPRAAGAGRKALAWGLEAEVAARAARRLARLDDPELPIVGAGIPSTAPLLALLGVSGDDTREIEARWTATDGTAALSVPIGADGDGPVLLDFVADGPHLLVGGTTGSGKSELLRSIVAGIAATADADHVAMVLIDYKGGAAFDCCADLPHVAGLVTDLDADLASRALRCLEAELRYRELRLREVGADNMETFREIAASGARVGLDESDPLPRLVVVVDEFASMAADLPDFLDALVGIAQRGRSLGVHMVLATQRPAGVITDDIRANTACRIALRVTDRNDSVDVIDAPDAAAIPRHRPGRAVARFGPGELAPFQAAFVTGHSTAGRGVSIRGSRESDAAERSTEGPSDLRRLVSTIAAAHESRGGESPRSPWPPALSLDETRRDHAAARDGDWFVVDDPDGQRQRLEGWSLGDGHLVVIGAPGAGATTTLTHAALAVTRGTGAATPHLHAIDLDAGGLARLAGLRCAGTFVAPSDGVRRGRLLRWLDDEVARRRLDQGRSDPPILLLLDDLGGLARAHDPIREPAIHDRFVRVWADGPAVGVVVAASLRRAADLPPALTATVGTVLLHRSADQSDGLRFGSKTSTEGYPPGRAVRAGDGAVLQVMRGTGSVESEVRARATEPASLVGPHEVGELRAEIPWSESEPSIDVSTAGCEIRIAIRDRDLALAVLRLHPGEHAIVLGPPRSGRTSALVALARAGGADVVVVGDGELAQRAGLVPVSTHDLADALAARSPTMVLVDDALGVADESGVLAQMVTASPPGVHIVASARPDRLRAAYGHWASDIKSSRAGLLLRPDPLDGDLLGQQFPARMGLDPVPGRGVMICDAQTEVVQVVLSD